MRKSSLFLLGCMLLTACATEKAVGPKPEDEDIVPGSRMKITVSTGAPEEVETRTLLRQVLSTTNVESYFFVREARVEANGSPSSSPVINLDTSNHDRPDELLSQFLRLEIGAFMDGPEKGRVDAAIKEVARAFPDASDPRKLVQCALELQADMRYLGESRGRAVIAGLGFDQDLYAIALKHEPRIIGILKRREVDL